MWRNYRNSPKNTVNTDLFRIRRTANKTYGLSLATPRGCLVDDLKKNNTIFLHWLFFQIYFFTSYPSWGSFGNLNLYIDNTKSPSRRQRHSVFSNLEIQQLFLKYTHTTPLTLSMYSILYTVADVYCFCVLYTSAYVQYTHRLKLFVPASTYYHIYQ